MYGYLIDIDKWFHDDHNVHITWDLNHHTDKSKCKKTTYLPIMMYSQQLLWVHVSDTSKWI